MTTSWPRTPRVSRAPRAGAHPARGRAPNEATPDTESVARSYCPECEPLADPVSEILEVRWCEWHRPTTDGTEDEKVVASAYLTGSSEAGGDPNRAVCDFVHRQNTR